MSEGNNAMGGAVPPQPIDLAGLARSGVPMRIWYIEVGAAAPATPAPIAAADASPGRRAAGRALSGAAGYATAWNLQGHALIAYMAQQILQTEDQAAFGALVQLVGADPENRGDIGELAMWPDRIKHPPRGAGPAYAAKGWIELGKTTAPWHFVDIPYHPGSTEQPQIPEGTTILEGLPAQLAELATAQDPGAAANALAFVLHLVGDLHQPLHCACLANGRYEPPGFDKGGNLITWGTSEKRPPSLHAFWDDLLATTPAEVATLTASLLQRFPRAAFEHETSRNLTDWALDSHLLARKAYDRFLAESAYDEATGRYAAPSAAYKAWATDVAQERAALAAYRLADLLAERLVAPGRTDGPAPPRARTNGNGHATPGKRARRPRRPAVR
jgi:hypothetical protein